MGINHARHQCSAAAVDDVSSGRRISGDFRDSIVLNGDIDGHKRIVATVENIGIGESEHNPAPHVESLEMTHRTRVGLNITAINVGQKISVFVGGQLAEVRLTRR